MDTVGYEYKKAQTTRYRTELWAYLEANSAFEEIDLTERKHYAVREKNIIQKMYHQENKHAACVSS
jgi:hypothetical protein